MPAGASRDVLWRIVAECLDPTATDYCTRCRTPLVGTCAAATACRDTTEVWAATPEHVAIRDIKMCGCPAGFVHGLALPRTPVTGVEDPRRPDGIWAFAWDVARARIAPETDIALVVNPVASRGQDQLHVHLVRLRADARTRLAARAPVTVERLDEVWAAAARPAGAGTLGVVVARAATGGFLVVTAGASGTDNPESEFTRFRCR